MIHVMLYTRFVFTSVCSL